MRDGPVAFTRAGSLAVLTARQGRSRFAPEGAGVDRNQDR